MGEICLTKTSYAKINAFFAIIIDYVCIMHAYIKTGFCMETLLSFRMQCHSLLSHEIMKQSKKQHIYTAIGQSHNLENVTRLNSTIRRFF